jgi:hypothetical protein
LSKQKCWWQGCSSDELPEEPATSTCRLETLLATTVVELHSTPPMTKIVTLANLLALRRRENKQRERERESLGHVTISSTD